MAEKGLFPDLPSNYYVGKMQHVFTIPPMLILWHVRDIITLKVIVVTILYPITQAPTPETSLKYVDHELMHSIEKEWRI